MRRGTMCLTLTLALVACSGAPGMSTGEGATTSGEATTSSQSASTTNPDGMSSTSAATTTTTVSSTTAGESTGCMFLCDPDVRAEFCDPWLQDCPEGEKCAPTSPRAGSPWIQNECVPVDRNPDSVGESCSVVGGPHSGVDSCDDGAMCWDVDSKTNVGMCVALCVGNEQQCTEDPKSCCPPWSTCTIPSGGALILCLATCHPLIQNCQGQGDFCYLAEDWSLCVPDASGDTGQPGDPCEAMNACDPGTYCGDPKTYPGCDLMAGGCCIPFCDLLAPECAPGSVCQPYFENNDTPPGFKDLGACVIP